MRVTRWSRREVSDNLATELRDSGRYVSELALPSNAYASAVTPARFQVSKQGGASRSGDFQLQGR